MYRLEAVPFSDVQIKDSFWSPRQETNRLVTIPHCLEMLEQAGNFHNFRIAAEGKREGYRGPRYMDSDLYKTLEGICYSLTTHPNPALEARVDEIISLIASAQMPDGYLNTYFQVNKPDRRWTNLRDDHELYCAGHLIEAAVAHQQMLNKNLPPGMGEVPEGEWGRRLEDSNRSALLNVALKFCEHIWQQFGPDGKPGYPGHPEVELALVKLWKLTGDQRWFDLAKLFIDRRGSGYFRKEHAGEMKPPFDENYFVDIPVESLEKGIGHAVRFCYLMCGAADIAESHDKELISMLERTWRHVTDRQMYVTGGVGSNPDTEGFADDYQLPNSSGYQETCASIAMAMWGHRLWLLTGDNAVWDAIETVIYNALPSGVSLDGKSFFYENPLASDGSHRRQPWFQCACCPPNVLRTIASLGSYCYGKTKNELYVNLYFTGSVRTDVGGGTFAMDCQAWFPDRSGESVFTIRSEREMTLHFRVPSWCRRPPHIKVNGQPAAFDQKNGYITVHRQWNPGNHVSIKFEISVTRLRADPRNAEAAGKLAFKRGPLIYCAEQIDNSMPINDLRIAEKTWLYLTFVKGLEGVISMEAKAPESMLIPYAFWANRDPGAMRVWIPT